MTQKYENGSSDGDELPTTRYEVAPDDDDDSTAVAGNQQSEGKDDKNEPGVAGTGLTGNTHIPVEVNIAAEPPLQEESKSEKIASRNESEKKSSSFAQLVKSWESYMTDTQNNDKFQPMQVFQTLGFCGTGQDLPRLTLAPSTEFTNTVEGKDPFEPIVLRHTHSTPLQYRPSFFNEYEGSDMPPPAQLDSTRRSSSTPSRGSAFQSFNSRSAFGSHLRSTSGLSRGSDGRSAFGLPLQRSHFSAMSTESNIRSSAFNPISLFPLPPTQEEPVSEENTSIEVMDLGRSEYDTKASNVEGEAVPDKFELEFDKKISTEEAKPRKSAAARAARFLSDVGVLRRKKKGVRGSLLSVTSTETGSSKQEQVSSSDVNDSWQEGEQESKKDSFDQPVEDDNGPPTAAMYQELDSDMDEEFDRYQSIENTGKDSEDSPQTIPSPAYHPIDDTCGDKNDDGSDETRRPAVRIQVSCNSSTVSQITERVGHDISSPSPGGNVAEDEQSRSSHSPGGATRSSATTTTSGHTTQATSMTSHTGDTSGHSHVSETDREVMEAIKEGKRRRRQEAKPLGNKVEGNGSVTIDSSSSGSTTTNGYVALAESPGPLRDGANVMADRFFRNSRSPVLHGGYPSCSSNVSTSAAASIMFPSSHMRSRTSSLPTSRHTATSNGSPTDASLSGFEEKPPTFVSYLDRQAASDLTSLRGITEASIYRGDIEEREDSPAEIIGYPAFLNDVSSVAPGQENSMSAIPKLVLPSKDSLYSMLDRFRSRPPRDPSKGLRTLTPTTPPPRLGSPAYHHQLSPPRNIVDSRIVPNVSRPYVVRTNPSTQKIVLVSPGSYVRPTTPLVCIPVGNHTYSPSNNMPLNPWSEQPSPYGGHNLMSRTYEEHNIEILKTDSRDELICRRTPTPESASGVKI